MNIVLHSNEGDAIGLALRLQAEGHDVGVHIVEEKCKAIGRGLVHQVDDFLVATEKADLILFDQVGSGSLADLLRAQGKTVLGGGKALDLLELDRAHAMRTMKALGFRVPLTKEFKAGAFDEAETWLKYNPGRYVFKASGHIACEKTFVAEDVDDMMDYLEHLDETIEAEEGQRPAFLLQTFVPGVEVSTEVWYAEGKRIPGLSNITFERKKFLVGDLGPSVGCAGSVVLPHQSPALLADFAGVDKLAAAHDWSGCFDVNRIVGEDDHKLYWLENTCRFGYSAMQTFLSMWQGDLGDALHALAKGKDPRVTFSDRVGIGVDVSIPPYPSKGAESQKGTPVVDDVLEDDGFWPTDVMWDDEHDKLVVAGAHGLVYVAVAQGRSIDAARRTVYEHLGMCRLPDRQWRNDIGSQAAAAFTQLQAWGLC